MNYQELRKELKKSKDKLRDTENKIAALTEESATLQNQVDDIYKNGCQDFTVSYNKTLEQLSRIKPIEKKRKSVLSQIKTKKRQLEECKLNIVKWSEKIKEI